jgi:putative DNA primase/helicase
MHGFDAPAAGTGKSKLVNVTSLISSGHEAPVITLGKTEEEAEKRLGAALIAGGTLISIDNRKEPIDSDLLCMALTQEIVDVRLLGKSNFVSTFNTAVFFVNGNNLVVTGDLVRRTIVGLMNAQREKPELRTFTTEDPVLTVKRDRPKSLLPR